MQVRKGLVVEFLLHVKAKAFDSVIKRQREEREAFAKKYAEENAESTHIKALIELDKMVPVFRSNIANALEIFGAQEYRFYRDNFPNSSFFDLFFSYPVGGCSESSALFEAHELETKKLRDEYYKIEQALQNFAKGKPAMEYLRSLGFDVSWIEKRSVPGVVSSAPTDIDTAVLFPCKKQGLD